MKAKRSDFKDLMAWQYHRDVIEPVLQAVNMAVIKEVLPMISKLPYKLSLDDATSNMVDMAFKMALDEFYRRTTGIASRINPIDDFTDVQKGLISDFANKMVKRSVKESKSLVKDIGTVNIFALDRDLNRRKDGWISTNVNEIKNIPQKQFKSVQTQVWNAINSGEHIGNAQGDIKGKKGLMTEIMESFKVSQNQAKLIARDQTLKFMSTLQKETFENLGIEYYRWSDSSDQRVRASHAKADQLIFKLGEAPPVGSNGDNVEPGQDFQCRCQRIPYMPAVRGEVKMVEGGPLGSYKPVKIKQVA